MPNATPPPPLGFEVSVKGVSVDENTGQPATTVIINGSTVTIGVNGDEPYLRIVHLASPDSIGFAGRRYLARLAQAIEGDYAESIAVARGKITAELTKAYAA